jgi:cobalamin biosynthesis Mg chelatase CobN
VIIDHLMPPLTRAETYGPLRHLEQLADEYYEAQLLDPRRARELQRDILELVKPTTSTATCSWKASWTTRRSGCRAWTPTCAT